MIGQIGQLDTRILIQTGTESTDAQGSTSQSWATAASVWARAESIAATESTAGNEREAFADYQFTVRYQASLAALTTKHRVQWRSANYDILGIRPLPEGRPDRLLITTRRKAA